MIKTRMQCIPSRVCLLILSILACLAATTVFAANPTIATNPTAQRESRRILDATGVQGGLIVHVGCGDGKLTAAFGAQDGYLVQGLDVDPGNVAAARGYIQSLGLYGDVSVDRFDGTRLPYIDNLVNLVVAEDLGSLSMEEVTRVLCPGGTAYVKLKRDSKAAWTKTVKPRPETIDDWTHYLHDASNNAVAHDSVVGPPRRMQWVGSPRYARHHDRMSSVSAVVSAGGRVFSIFDEAPPASILSPPQWSLIARDAFNGTILWKRPIEKWHTHLWPLKSGPAQLPRRLVAIGDRVYVTLNLNGPLVALDAATGETVRTFENTQATEELIFHDGTLFALVNREAADPEFANLSRINQAYRSKFWNEEPRHVMAFRADSGKLLWDIEATVLPATLAADSARVVFHDGTSIVCLDHKTGKESWRSETIDRSKEIQSFYLPILVLYDDVVLFSGGETAGLQTGSWYTSGKDSLFALSAETGKVLWTGYHPPSGYRSPEDLLVVDGLVWTGETTSGRAVGVFTGRDPRTGEVKSEFSPDVDVYWFHHRCYRGKATENYLLMARTGTEFIDIHKNHWTANHWVRGACLYGVMPANGLLYAPQHPCACYLETKLSGFNALAPAAAEPMALDNFPQADRLERGPAYDAIPGAGQAASRSSQSAEDWPTYRHDAARSGRATTSIRANLEPSWRTKLGGKLSSPVIAGGKLFVASIDEHTVHALDTASGEPCWKFTAGARVDSSPTVYQGRVLFGSADGWVYCLRASDGALAWRFLAAPIDRRVSAFEQLESAWPVPGNVLVQNDVLYCVAGRSMFLDGGLRLVRLDPKTGQLLSETVLDDRDPAASDGDMHAYVSWLNMPVALPDILSSDGRLVYMRSQPFELDGTRLPLEAMPMGPDADRGAPPATQRAEHAHLFAPTGYLDDTWWHRTYWMYGSRFVSGWCGYFTSGKATPAGRILAFDDQRIYGFGRKPQYYRWTTPIEHHLFAADRKVPDMDAPAEPPKQTRVRVEKSKSLSLAGMPFSVEAWVKADQPNGAILASGGGVQGYAFYLRGGRPHFAIRTGSKQGSVTAEKRIVGRWVHLTGVLTETKEMRLYLDGKLAASGEAPALIAANPAEAMEIGADDGSAVGDYTGPFPFGGLIDEVKIYRRALSESEIEKHAAGEFDESEPDRVLAYSFDDGKATDASSNENHGTVEGAETADGKIGQALKFEGGPVPTPGFLVQHHWTQDLPLFARAMVLTDGTLFVAGPADMVDEDQAFKAIDDPSTATALADQTAVFAGKQGATLLAISTDDGQTATEYPLDAMPIFDGMAAAAGHLYLSTTEGSVVCLKGR